MGIAVAPVPLAASLDRFPRLSGLFMCIQLRVSISLISILLCG